MTCSKLVNYNSLVWYHQVSLAIWFICAGNQHNWPIRYGIGVVKMKYLVERGKRDKSRTYNSSNNFISTCRKMSLTVQQKNKLQLMHQTVSAEKVVEPKICKCSLQKISGYLSSKTHRKLIPWERQCLLWKSFNAFA